MYMEIDDIYENPNLINYETLFGDLCIFFFKIKEWRFVMSEWLQFVDREMRFKDEKKHHAPHYFQAFHVL